MTGGWSIGRWKISGQAVLVAQVWLLSRLLIAVVGVALMVTQGWTAGELVRRWDALHFMAIAANGYADATTAAFFPGLPLLLRAGTLVGLPTELTGVIVAAVGSALAAAALYRLFGAPAACLWLLAPTAVFTAVGYTEAPFCAAAFWAWQRARDSHWGQAGVLAGLACTFRVSGVFLVAGLACLAVFGLQRGGASCAIEPGPRHVWGTRWGTRLRRLAWLAIPVAVLVAFECYLRGVTGSWTAWLDAEQAGWTRGFAWPWQSLLNTVRAGHLATWPGRPDVAWVFRAEVVSMAAGLAATVWCLARRRWPSAVFVGLQVVVFGTSWWYMSVNRAVLVWFPLWAMLGAAVIWRPGGRRHRTAWRFGVGVGIVVSVVAMVVWAWLFFTGRWAS